MKMRVANSFDLVANRDVGKPTGDMPLDGFANVSFAVAVVTVSV